MSEFVSLVVRGIWGFATGIVIAGGIVSFITIIGIVPRLAIKTNTLGRYKTYENAITLGCFAGIITTIWGVSFEWELVGTLLMMVFAFAYGIFVGCLIVALAEILDVIPIMNRRLGVRKGLWLILVMLALGKMVGSLLYWNHPIIIGK